MQPEPRARGALDARGDLCCPRCEMASSICRGLANSWGTRRCSDGDIHEVQPPVPVHRPPGHHDQATVIPWTSWRPRRPMLAASQGGPTSLRIGAERGFVPKEHPNCGRGVQPGGGRGLPGGPLALAHVPPLPPEHPYPRVWGCWQGAFRVLI